jgi:hypothetical protein
MSDYFFNGTMFALAVLLVAICYLVIERLA